MLSQLLQGDSEPWNSTNVSIVILTVLFLLLAVWRGWRWAKLISGSNIEPARKQPTPRWLLRPSNLLFVLGVVVSIYAEIQRPTFVSFPLRRLRWGIFLLAFLLRFSENKAVAGLGDSTRDDKEFENFPRKDGRLD